jgi:hypothetical protein
MAIGKPYAPGWIWFLIVKEFGIRANREVRNLSIEKAKAEFCLDVFAQLRSICLVEQHDSNYCYCSLFACIYMPIMLLFAIFV